jgi:Holliday junction resolvase
MLESQIQAKIIKRYQSEGWIVVKLIKTNTNGIPDLMCLRNGETIFIEVKRPTGKLSELQKHRIKQLEDEQFKVFVLYE